MKNYSILPAPTTVIVQILVVFAFTSGRTVCSFDVRTSAAHLVCAVERAGAAVFAAVQFHFSVTAPGFNWAIPAIQLARNEHAVVPAFEVIAAVFPDSHEAAESLGHDIPRWELLLLLSKIIPFL